MLYGPFAASFKSIVKSQPNYSRLSIFIGQETSVVALLLTTLPSEGSFPDLESRCLPCCGIWRTNPQALPPESPINPLRTPPQHIRHLQRHEPTASLEAWTQAADSGSQFVFDLSISEYTVGFRSVDDRFSKSIDRNYEKRIWHGRLSCPEWAHLFVLLVSPLNKRFLVCVILNLYQS